MDFRFPFRRYHTSLYNPRMYNYRLLIYVMILGILGIMVIIKG